MAGFGDDAIAIVTDGLRFSTGTFEERLISDGFIGDITTTVILVKAGGLYLFLTLGV